jgi:Ca2+-binding RTX toxin-like protein
MEILLALLVALGLGALISGGSDDDPDTPSTDSDPAVGTDGDDTVVLTGGPDFYDGGAGNDSIDGLAGFDTIAGGTGNDIIEGDLGKDELLGGAGYDTLSGGGWNDILSGGGGFDDLDGGSGNDQLSGGDGKDLLEGGSGNDILNGDAWVDGLFGGDGNDVLNGGNGGDLLVGGAGDDSLFGGSGDDLLLGSAGHDFLDGGDGDDVLIGSMLFSRELTSEDYTSLRSDTLPINEDGDSIFPEWGLTGTDVASSENLDDTLIGGDGNDLLFLGQNDVATGGAGFDDFVIGDWIGRGNAALVTDFDTSEDVIVVMLADDNVDAEITITDADLESGNGRLILIDGITAAIIVGTFDPVDGLGADVFTSIYTPA